MEQLSQQKMEALMKGNEIRLTRAADKRQIKAGRLDPAQILRQPPEHWLRAPPLELLMSVHRVGKSRARKWLWSERIDPGLEIGQISEMQRYRLARHLDAALQRAGKAAG